MSQSLTLDIKGLHTYASPISGVPLGSLAVGLNVSINRAGVCEPRRGFDYLTYSLPLEADRIYKLVFWNSSIFAYYNSATFAYYNPSSGFTSLGSLVPPSNSYHCQFVNCSNKNLYVTSSTGLRKTDSSSTSLYSAGVPKGLTIDLSVAGAGTAIENAKYATYQYILGRKDANSNIHYGAPSGRFTIHNTAGTTQNVTAKCYLPSGLTTSFFIQLYRTTGESSSDATGEELKLCYETPISSSDISNGYISITDITPDSLLLGATIYTAPSQQGAVNENAMPPQSTDITEYKNHLFFSDVTAPQRLIFSLISVSGSGLVAGNTITLTCGGVTETYTAHGTTFDASGKQFVVSGSGSTGIDSTIKSFIKCVNLSSALVYAYSMSTGPTDLPGKILIEAKTTGTAVFTLVSNNSAAFQPQLTSPTTINNTSAADTFSNAIMHSKIQQYEAVPTKNTFKVGASDDKILRIITLRDGLFIFKEKDGVYVLRGDSESNFSVQLLDNTAKLISPQTIVTVNNLIYGLFEAGICEVSDTGVNIISLPVKDQLLPLYGAPLDVVKRYAFGIGNDVDGKYILAFPEVSTDTYCVKQLVLDTFNRTFVNYDLPVTCGAVNPADSKLYLGKATKNVVQIERKAFDYTDYADYQDTCTVSSYRGTTVYISGTNDMAKGDIVYQGTTAMAYVESVNTTAGSIVVDSEQTWTLSTANVTHMKAIDCKIQWNPDTGANAGALKQYYECSLISAANFQKEASVYFYSDINPSEVGIDITSSSGNGAFGQFIFGDGVFGGETPTNPKRLGIPRQHSRCSQLNVRFENKVAYSDFEITGLALSFNATSTRVDR